MNEMCRKTKRCASKAREQSGLTLLPQNILTSVGVVGAVAIKISGLHNGGPFLFHAFTVKIEAFVSQSGDALFNEARKDLRTLYSFDRLNKDFIEEAQWIFLLTCLFVS